MELLKLILILKLGFQVESIVNVSKQALYQLSYSINLPIEEFYMTEIGFEPMTSSVHVNA